MSEYLNEPKLCPLHMVETGKTRATFGEPLKELMVCVQEKCTWWVPKKEEVVPYKYAESCAAPLTEIAVTLGHCVVLDWGKPGDVQNDLAPTLKNPTPKDLW